MIHNWYINSEMWKQHYLSYESENKCYLDDPWINWHRTAFVPTLNTELTRSLQHNLDLNKFYINFFCVYIFITNSED